MARYVTPEAVAHARKVDLLDYLRASDPGNLVHVAGCTYCTREHDSLKISNGKWMWFSRGFGGHGALDYLTKMKGMPFQDAVEHLSSHAKASPSKVRNAPQARRLLLPEKNDDAEVVTGYLTGRGIDRTLVKELIAEDLIYESKGTHHCIFIGTDQSGTTRYAAYRATNGERLMGEASGSDKTYSFNLHFGPDSKVQNLHSGALEQVQELHLFESAIDLLSYATLQKKRGLAAENCIYLSLGGVYGLGTPGKLPKLPKSLTHCLETYPQTDTIHLHLDNDRAGRSASESIALQLKDRYKIVDAPPPFGKDYNEYLIKIARTRDRDCLSSR